MKSLPAKMNGRRALRPECPPTQCRQGFSLIELIIAMALSVILISAIYGAISLHWRYETLGRERINRSQISLAIFRKLSEDVGCVMFTIPEATVDEDDSSTSSSSAAGSSTTSTQTSTTSTSSTTPALSTATPVAGTGTTPSASTAASTGASALSSAMSGASSSQTTAAPPSVVTPISLGIVGTADYLQLDVNLPQVQDVIIPIDQTGSISATTIPATPSSDLVRITWMLTTPKQAETTTTGLASLIHNPALARHLADRLNESMPENARSGNSANSSSAIASDTTTNNRSTSTQTASLPEIPDSSILAREVVSLQFRYFDGYSWVTEWNSTQKGRLPRAVEVTMGFISQDPRYSKGNLQMGTIPVTTIKHVIQVPASTPVSGSEI